MNQVDRSSVESLHLVPFWEQRAGLEVQQLGGPAIPYLWNWNDVEPLLQAAGRSVPIEDCERRALIFANPGLSGKPNMTSTLFGAYSLYNPGEQAPVHRHTPSASRFVLEGTGGYTVVEGEKCTMERGDLIITPAGTWHDHGNDGVEPIIWMDVLNIPLVQSLDANVFEFEYREDDAETGTPIPKIVQSISEPEDHSQNLYGSGGITPLFASHERGITTHSPMFVYRWERARDTMEKLRNYEGSPYDGIILEYTDPVTGAPVMPTMSFRCQLLRPTEHTKTHRHTSSTVYCVLEGAGRTDVGNSILEWSRNDVFVVPSWASHRHINSSSSADAVLYSVTDEPTLRALGLFREEEVEST